MTARHDPPRRMSATNGEPIRQPHPFEVRCRSCGRPIVWFRTKNGKRMPVDAESCRPSDAEHALDLSRHRSHFATCRDADGWRRPSDTNARALERVRQRRNR